MKLVFNPEAEEDLSTAVAWYEERQPGLGLDFASEAYAAIQRALNFPEAWTQLEPGIRRVLVHRFPYGVLYTVRKSRLLVLAVMHLRRKPGYWRTRTENEP